MSFEAFIAYLSLEKNYSSHTVTAYKKDIQEFIAFTSKEHDVVAIDEVEYPIIRSWIINLVSSGISNRTINRKIASL
jgi:integrase/recombinase XerC